jgi:DNA mismatch repair protein MutS
MDERPWLTTAAAVPDALTPVMRQVWSCKRAHPDALVLFRLGDFYELFFEDAVEGAQLLDLALTSRNRNDERPIPMCGFPWHQMGAYVQKLVDAGRRAAVVEQLEDAQAAKGLIQRAVSHVITPGVVLDAGALDERRSHHVVALHAPRKGGLLLAVADVSTGWCGTATIAHHSGLGVLLTRLEPREIVLPGTAVAWLDGVAAAHGVPVTQRPAAHDDGGAWELLRAYLREVRPAAADLLEAPQSLDAATHLQLTREAVIHLELLQTARLGKKQGSLVHAVDRTVTAAGGRTLRSLLLAPLCDRRAIEARHEAVAALVGDRPLRDAIRGLLRRQSDVARIATRALAGLSQPRELAALRDTLETLPQLRQLLGSCDAPVLVGVQADLVGADALAGHLQATLCDAPRMAVQDGGVIRPGFDPELDELVQLADHSQQWLAQFEQQERAATGLQSLRVTYNRVTGYGIEITRAKAERVPAHYHRKQTLKNVERYTTDDLRAFERKIESADVQRMAREAELFRALVQQVGRTAGGLRKVAAALADLDVHSGFAEWAAEARCVRPRLVDAPVLQLVAGRHPVVEPLLGPGRFVPNDLDLRGPDATLPPAQTGLFDAVPDEPDDGLASCDLAPCQVLLVTGPNMAGKSTLMRQAALAVILAQAGAFVPADAAVLGVFDRVLTRIGAGDDIGGGASTFLVEMQETALLLDRAGPRSLVLLDEIGRGTSTWDGLAIAWAVVEALHDRRCLVLFATHYHELTVLDGRLARLRNAHVAVREHGGEVVFVHRVQPGPTNRSHGIAVAQLAGLPATVVARARKLLGLFENATANSLGDEGERKVRLRRQLGLFDGPVLPKPVERAENPELSLMVAELCDLDVDGLTPRQAHDLLAGLVARAQSARRNA